MRERERERERENCKFKYINIYKNSYLKYRNIIIFNLIKYTTFDRNIQNFEFVRLYYQTKKKWEDMISIFKTSQEIYSLEKICSYSI